jgi:hypothetical protein
MIPETDQPFHAGGRTVEIAESEGEAFAAPEVVEQDVVAVARVEGARHKSAKRDVEGLLGCRGRRGNNSEDNQENAYDKEKAAHGRRSIYL